MGYSLVNVQDEYEQKIVRLKTRLDEVKMHILPTLILLHCHGMS
jgi:hypothetical protein